MLPQSLSCILWCETCTMTSSSYVWGAVADRKGRKPVIITSCLLLGLFSAAFGFSINFAMAVLFRLAVGLTNGKQCDVKYVGPTCMSIHFPSYIKSVCCLSVSPFVCLFACLSVCLFICHLKIYRRKDSVTNIKFDKETSESQEATEMSFHLCFGFLFFNDWGEPE